MRPASFRSLVRVVHQAVSNGFATREPKGTHFRSFREPSPRVQPLTFDPLRFVPARFTRNRFQALLFVLSDDSEC